MNRSWSIPICSHQIYFTTLPLTMMINFIMVLFKLASKAFKHFVPSILKAFHVLTALCALFQFSIDFAFCLRCLCKTTINHSNNSNILKDESIDGSSGSSSSSSTTISLWNVLKILHFVRSFISLFTYRLFFFYRLVIDHRIVQNYTTEKYWHLKRISGILNLQLRTIFVTLYVRCFVVSI